MIMRRRRFVTWLASLALVALAVLSRHSSAQPATPAPQQIYTEAAAAYRDRAFGTYLDKMRTLADMRPTHPTILYKLAGAYALNERADDVARVLERLTALQLVFDVTKDADFAAVRTNAA
jgi:hypothetical protein